MATLKQIRDKANAQLALFWSELTTRQDAYYAKHGTYFGFNWTPALAIEDGIDTDLGEIQRPSRKHHAVDVSFPVNTKLPFQIQVIRHVGPLGHGYTATVKVQLVDGRVYARDKGYGPHSETRQWYQIIKEK